MSETKRNRNLGNYDMVLGLSSSKINHHFKVLYNTKDDENKEYKIDHKWTFLTKSTTGEIEKLVDQTKFEFYWENLKKIKVNEKYIIDNIEENPDEAMKKSSENKTIKKDLKDNGFNRYDYDLGLFANIAPPEIEILENKSKELIFKVKFKAGSKICYIEDNEPVCKDLVSKKNTNICYAFKVAIEKIQIDDSSKKIIEIDNNGIKKSISFRDKGINDNDFTIDGLLLDFQRANITDYDETRSNLTDRMKKNSSLQSALTIILGI